MSGRKPEVPTPPHSASREQASPDHLPGQDAHAGTAEKQAALQQSAAYISAVEDLDFLRSEDARGVRLQLDYLKAERLLQSHGIRHSIVVFGGTRLVEPTVASAAVNRLETALKEYPDDVALQRRLKAARRILSKSHYYDVARSFARLVGQSGDGPHDSRLVVVTGGGPGIMEAANRGADDVGAESAGLNISLPQEQIPNPYVTPDLCFQFHYFALRKLHFMLRARAFVAFPGGYGTLDELFETLTLIQTRKIEPLPVVLVGEAYWRRVVDIDFLVEEGLVDSDDRDLYWYAETAAEIWDGLLLWYRRNGESLLPVDEY